MKNCGLTSKVAATLVLTLLTVGLPVWAAESSSTTSATLEDTGPQRLTDLGTHLNPQVGVSSFEYSGRNGSAQRLTGGATAEFGEGIRRMEAGLLLVQAGGKATLSRGTTQDVQSTFLTIPMMAKIRIMQMHAQSWFLKGGVMTAFEVGSNSNGATNNLDVLVSLGLGGRFLFTKNADFIIEATFNRGLLQASRTGQGSADFNQGALILAGLSFRL